jgi:hypothetical protein
MSECGIFSDAFYAIKARKQELVHGERYGKEIYSVKYATHYLSPVVLSLIRISFEPERKAHKNEA